jgi:hypothetical protein
VKNDGVASEKAYEVTGIIKGAPLLLEPSLQLEYVERYMHPFMASHMRAASHVVQINATFLFFNDANARGGM